jgi:hypothetical protein
VAYNTINPGFRYFIGMIIFASFMLIPIIQNSNNTSFAQSEGTAVIFRSVSADTNPVPNKSFNFSASISVPKLEHRHVLVSLSVPRAITIISPAIVDLGDISRGDTDRTITWTLLATRPGSYLLNITAYSSTTGIANTNNKFESTTFKVSISVGYKIDGNPAFQIQSVKAIPPLSYPGGVGTRLDLNVVNSGYVIANDIRASLLNLHPGIYPAWGGADSVYIGTLLPGQNYTASYFLNVRNNATSTNYPLSLALKYDTGNTILKTNFIVSPKAKFELVDVDDSNLLYPGATNVPLKVSLKNTGTATAETIITKFLGGNIIPGVKSVTQTSIGDVENIGSIIPGQVFTTTFIVNADVNTQAGEQAASLEVTWTQTETSGTSDENMFIQTIPMTYNVLHGPDYLLYYNGIPLTYVAILVGLVIIILVFILLRKRRNKIVNSYIQEESYTHSNVEDRGAVFRSKK